MSRPGLDAVKPGEVECEYSRCPGSCSANAIDRLSVRPGFLAHPGAQIGRVTGTLPNRDDQNLAVREQPIWSRGSADQRRPSGSQLDGTDVPRVSPKRGAATSLAQSPTTPWHQEVRQSFATKDECLAEGAVIAGTNRASTSPSVIGRDDQRSLDLRPLNLVKKLQ